MGGGGTCQVTERAERHKVGVQFFGVAARLVAEKIWHPTQKLTRRKEGSVILEMTVADLGEVAAWVLSFGPDARVLAPTELRRQVGQEAMGAAQHYSQDRRKE